MDEEEKTRNKKSEEVMSEVARGGRKRRIATGEAEEVKVEQTRGSSERETEEVEELASNSRLLDRDQQRRRNFDERGERGFQRYDHIYVGGWWVVGVVVNAVRAFIVDGRVAELIGEKATGKQVGEKGTLHFSNHLTLKQRRKGELFLSIYPKPNTLLRHVLIFMKLLIVCHFTF